MKKITILHQNDIHGTFAGEKDAEGHLRQSIAQVSGYVARAKEENPNTVYCIAGDVFQGSLIDSDFLGLSTMNILNYVGVDVMALGNHELDYGIAHMLFAAKSADFPVINANFVMRRDRRHLFEPYHVVDVGGIRVLFIGLITESIVDETRMEGVTNSFVCVEDAANEIVHIHRILAEKGIPADLTVLLTHIGYEEDLKLAQALDPAFGVDVIVGGHSHTYLEEPTVENGIVIVQVGMENTHIGKLDLFFDEKLGKPDRWTWETVPVDEEHCPTDKFVRALVSTYIMDVDEKYGKVVTRLCRTLDNQGRGNATEVGQLFADVFADSLGLDVMLLSASSLRGTALDMTVTLQDLMEAYPYNGRIVRVKLSGEILRKIIRHMLRDEVLDSEEEVFFHTSENLHIEYGKDTRELKVKFKGRPLRDDQILCVGIQEYYYLAPEPELGVTQDELNEAGGGRVIAPDAREELKQYLSEHADLGGPIDDRYIVHGTVRGVTYP